MKVSDNTINVIRQAFKEFYYNNNNLLEVPEAIEEREFGYSKFDGTMVRHIGIKNVKELIALLVREVPADVYCSSAYYSNPSKAMQEKGLKAADLIFDIDIKELNTLCSARHDVYICSSCNNMLDLCECSNQSIKHIPFPCDECISIGKREVSKLLAILEDDFGIDEGNIGIYFSGNNGFHIHVKDRYKELDANARAEIVNYISAKGLEYSILFKANSVKKRRGKGKGSKDSNLFRLNPDGYGWVGRISRQVIKERSLRNDNYADSNAISKALSELGVRIDPNVTIDMHRIFRLAGTLNSKSSLAKVKCTDLDSFNPFNNACFISDREVYAYIVKAPRFMLKGNTFGPFAQEYARIPLYAFCYLACKGLAEIPND